MKHELWIEAARYVDRELIPDQIALLRRYGDWLGTEAVRSGGLGPAEASKVDLRHIADSLLFATAFPEDPDVIWDLGSGVGLPGIPLAILLGDTGFHLIDRSGRRVELMKRAVRVLGLDNITVEQAELWDLSGPFPAVVSRATLPPTTMKGYLADRLAQGGIAVQGGSWAEKPVVDGWQTVEIPANILDHSVWLLIMRRR